MRMKMTLGVFALIWFVSGLTHADTIGLYADIGGTNCNIELQPYLTYIHVVHVTDGATGCKFMAPRPECLAGAIPVCDQCVLAPPSCCCGDSQTGMTIEYGSCRSGAIEILRMVYRRGPDMDPCCVYPLLAHPDSPGGQVMVMDCGIERGAGSRAGCDGAGERDLSMRISCAGGKDDLGKGEVAVR